ncbi:hypothetical protein [Halorussus aquaticus]|uniref:Envelope protein N-terminal domain-containing protein n=1 Tax=Halorussus aquaticus TaxID=2953748 RepID=A0ABD5Q342_9EURY|nr:hypothetical protein [Halorussus aquaticus]
MKDTEDGDDEPVNDESGGVTVSRRQLMQALGAAGVTAAAGSSLTGSVAAQTNTTTTSTTTDGDTVPGDTPPDKYWMEQNYSDYVAQDDAKRLYTLPSGREVASMFMLQTPALGQTALAMETIQRADGYSPGELFDAVRGSLADVYYDPYNPGDVASGTVLQQAWYDIVEAHQLLERGITQWQSDMGENEELAHAEIELATRAAFNSGRTVSQAKSDARTAVRDLLASSEQNLLILIEEILIRINGVFFRVASELDNTSLKDYWSFNSGAKLTHDNFTLHQPSMHPARVSLMDGRILETGVMQLLPEQDTDEMLVHPLYDTIAADGRWEWVPTTTDSKTYPIPPINYAPPDFLSDSEYQLLSYNQDLSALASEMYNKLWSLVRTFDQEIDAYVDTMYSSYAGRGKIPMSDLSNAAIRRELGMDWYQTGSTGFAIIEALRRGKRTNTEFHVDVEILGPSESQGEGERIDETIVLLGGAEGWTPGAAETVSYDLTEETAVIDGTELHIKGQPANGQHTVTYADGTSETYQYGQVMTSGEWMQSSDAADWTASFYLRLDSDGYSLSDIESVSASVDEALRVGETYRIPDPRANNEEIIVADYDSLWRSLTEPGEGIHIHSVVNAAGEEVGALHMRDGRQTELSTDGAEELMRQQIYTAAERTRHRRKYDPPGGGGAGGGGAGGDDGGSGLWMWGAAIGAGALAALGLQGGDDR